MVPDAEGEERRIRLLCVDDHAIVREGLAALIRVHEDMELVGAAASGEEAIVMFHRHRPDITLVDLRLGSDGLSGLDVIRAIRSEDAAARIVVLTMYQGDEDIHRALEAGATTYLGKDTLWEELAQVIRRVHGGEHPTSAAVEEQLAKRATEEVLTDREVEVMQLVAQGMRNKEIGARLGISELTVQVHVKNILVKLHVNDRAAAINVAARRGIIHIG
jgi:DNA-binding NarL/FixJ family response regulator